MLVSRAVSVPRASVHAVVSMDVNNKCGNLHHSNVKVTLTDFFPT